MINIVLKGGLGNQMFQYALGRSLQLRGREVTFNLSRVHKLEGEQPHDRTKPQYGLDGFNVVLKEGPAIGPLYSTGEIRFDDKAFNWQGDGTLDGYWQSEKFFSTIKTVLNLEFVPKGVDPAALFTSLNNYNYQSAVQIRRGDYVQFSDFHGPLPASYYREGLKAVDATDGVLVFTDDPEWVLMNEEEIFGGRSWAFGNTGSRHTDITRMSLCDKIVIANSTFGWWGAWLGDMCAARLYRKVVAPAKWFGPGNSMYTGDIVPERWTKL